MQNEFERSNSNNRREGSRLCGQNAEGCTKMGGGRDIRMLASGLPSQRFGSNEQISRAEVQRESERLISDAKKEGLYISPLQFSSYGSRKRQPSGESIVFIDKSQETVIKVKDPFAKLHLKGNNPYNVLFEHLVHNFLFPEAPYAFIGVSEEFGDVRFVFEQPYIKESFERASEIEVNEYMSELGFEKSGYYYTDGYVSVTDLGGDNVLKSSDGKLYFIDPIFRFDVSPRDAIAHCKL